MSVSCECLVLLRTGVCVGLITHPEGSYRVCVPMLSRNITEEAQANLGCGTTRKIALDLRLDGFQTLSEYCEQETLPVPAKTQHRLLCAYIKLKNRVSYILDGRTANLQMLHFKYIFFNKYKY
jgi:hypothetical protein